MVTWRTGEGGSGRKRSPGEKQRNAEIMRPEGGRGGCLLSWFLAQLQVLPQVQTRDEDSTCK